MFSVPLLLSLPYGPIFSAPETTNFLLCLCSHLSTSVSEQHTHIWCRRTNPQNWTRFVTSLVVRKITLLQPRLLCWCSYPSHETYFTRSCCLLDLSIHIRVAGHDVSIVLYGMGNFHSVWGKKRAIHVVEWCRSRTLTLLPHLYVLELIVCRIKRNTKVSALRLWHFIQLFLEVVTNFYTNTLFYIFQHVMDPDKLRTVQGPIPE